MPFDKSAPSAFAKPARSAEVVAVVPGRGNKAAIFAYEQGSRLVDRKAAPGRRVGFFVTEENLAVLSQEGETLLVAALTWAAETSQK